MTKQDENAFKGIVIEALGSLEVKGWIKSAVLETLQSREGQDAIKSGALEAMKSKEGKEIFTEEMTEWYHDVLEPTLEDMWDDIRQLKTEIRHMKEKNDIRFQRLERKAGVTSI